MKLYITAGSPYARLTRIVIHELGLAAGIELVMAKTRTPDSPYYALNPSGRVPFLVRDHGLPLEDSQLICRYLDRESRLHPPFEQDDWAYGRLETYARSMLDGLAVHGRELRRPENERSPAIVRHETERAARLADFWDAEVAHPLMSGAPNIAQFLLVVALDFARASRLPELGEGHGRRALAAWAARMREQPSVRATAK